MFGGTTPSEYDDIVNKTTDENLTSENWELILNLCDKVQDEGQTGAHAAIAAILKRLAHRNPNVQLYALSLAEALSKNLDIVIHREIASRAFTQGLEKLITDRNTHEKVRRRALGLIATWTTDFEKDTTLGIMEDCYNNLKAKNYKFEQPSEPAPPTVDDEIRRKEEEELQRVLEMSMQDRGGLSQWSQYSLAPATSSGSAGGPASRPSASNKSSAATASSSTAAASHSFAQPKYPGGGYVPARTPSPVAAVPQQQQQQHYQQPQTQPQPQSHQQTSSIPPASANSSSAPAPAPVVVSTTTTATPAAAATSGSAMAENGNIVTRVRALHTFEPTEPGELAFEKGDIIKVVDRGYKDWWRGQLKGRTGIFPVNYVEAMPEPTAAELAKEAEQEAAVFAQAVNVEKLLNMLRALDPAKDNLADNEEIQELYRSSMALRPKIVKLIDKYSQKRADLVSMNETFVRARTIFDRMMEESLARHTGVYEQQPYHPSQYPQGRPDSRSTGRRQDYQPSGRVPQTYGWNPNVFESGYNGYPTPGNAYPGQIQVAGSSQDPAGVPVPYGTTTPGPSGLGPQQQQPQGYPDPNLPSPYGPVSAPGPSAAQQQIQVGYGAAVQGGYTGHQPNVPYTQQGPMPYPTQQQPVQQQLQQQPTSQQPIQAQVVQQQPIQVQAVQQSAQAQPAQQQPAQAQPVQQQPAQAQPVPAQHIQQPIQAQPLQQQPAQPQVIQQQPIQVQQVPLAQHSIEHQQSLQHLPIQVQPEAVQVQAQVQASPPASAVSPQPQPQPQQQQQQPTAPPYIYDPNATYADPNVQAWAQYYAQGGKDLAGSVYFISIPGLTDSHAAGSPQQREVQQAQQAHNQVQQQQHSANEISGHRSLEGYNASVQPQQQSYQTQPLVSGINLSYAAATHHQQQEEEEQPSQLQELQATQLSQHQPPQHAQGQIHPHPQPQPQSRSQSLHEYDYAAQNPYQQQQSSVRVADVEPTQSSPTRSTFSGLNRGGSLSAGGIGGVQAGITGSGSHDGYPNPMQPTTSATPSWVLPKKTPPATVAGGSPIHAQRDVGGSPLSNQFGGISLSDPGVSRNPPNQGVGMLA